VIGVQHLWFEYDVKRPPVFEQFSLDHSRGALTILGPTGSGKTTLLKILASRERPTRGTVVVAGHDVARHPLQVRRRVGYVPQEIGLPGDLSLEEYLTALALVDGFGEEAGERVEAAVAAVHLEAAAHRRLSTFSGGMKRRSLLAQALMREPAVLLVDTPTAGLDPHEQILVMELLRRYSEERVVVMATNVPEEAVQLPGRVLVLDAGRAVADLTSLELAVAGQGHVFEVPWSFKGREDLWYVPTIRPEMVVVIAEKSPHQVAQVLPATAEHGYLYLLMRARSRSRAEVRA
jgi:ABC-2 type transport system ATP-binding protein